MHCPNCNKQYNERTGTALNFIKYPTEVVMLAVHYYYRFKVSLDDVAELMAMSGFYLSYQTVHNWVHIFGVDLGLKLRNQRYAKAAKKWHVDATYIKVDGQQKLFSNSLSTREESYLNKSRLIKSRHCIQP